MTIDRWWAWWRLARDVILFATAIGLVINEVVISSSPIDYGVLTWATGIFGLPIFLRSDEKRQREDQTPQPDPKP